MKETLSPRIPSPYLLPPPQPAGERGASIGQKASKQVSHASWLIRVLLSQTAPPLRPRLRPAPVHRGRPVSHCLAAGPRRLSLALAE